MDDVYQTVYFKNDKLGVYTYDPEEALDVSGNAIIRDSLSVSGFSIFADISANDVSFNNLKLLNSLQVNGTSNFDDISSNNVYFNNIKSNLVPNGIIDASNIVQLSIGSEDKAWKNLFVNDISVNKITALHGVDSSKNIFVEGNLVPDTLLFRDLSDNNNSLFSLGAPDNRWKSLYVSGNTVYINGSALGVKKTEQVQNDGTKKTLIELVFIPDEENNETNNNEDDKKTISIAKGEFIEKKETVVDPQTGEVTEVTVTEPVEESFTAATLLNLADVDISKNLLNDGDKIIYDTEKEKFVIGVKDTVNNSNQTFNEILTQQPQKFTFDSSANTTGSITLRWNYDDILLKDVCNNTLRLGYLPYDNVNKKDGMIPYIDKIHVDISGTTWGDIQSNDNNKWINFNIDDYINNGDRTIAITDDYNSNNTYKELTITKKRNPTTSIERILSEAGEKISFRIYGKNNSYDNEELRNNRALYFNNLEFKTANTPETPAPAINNFDIVSSNIVLNYLAGLAEAEDSTSLAKIIQAEINYSEIERDNISEHNLASPVNLTFNKTLTFSSLNISSNSLFTLAFNNADSNANPELRKGTKYKYRIRIKNNLNENYNNFTNFTNGSAFTTKPNSQGLGTQLTFSDNSNDKTSIASDTLNGNQYTYINLAVGNDNDNVFNPLVNSGTSRDFEISSDNFYGKSLDNQTDLANIRVFINGSSQATQISTFNGYDISQGNQTFNNITNISNAIDSQDNTFNFINISTDDLYQNSNDRGFRLKGNVIMNPIQRKDISSCFFGPSENPKSIKYEYTRSSNIGGSSNLNDGPFNIYIDDFNGVPLLTKRELPEINVTNVAYNMGLPSIHTFTLTFNTSSDNNVSSRVYSNMNSQYKFVRGDFKIADIQISGSSPNINKNGIQNILILASSIDSLGVYNLSNTNFTPVSNYYTNIQYTSSKLITGNTLTISEKTYSLNTDSTGKSEGTITLLMNHFCDKNSFNSSFQRNLSIPIYEIEDITTFANMENFALSLYTNHETKVKDSTLLFLNNQFRTNYNNQYPNIGPNINTFSFQNFSLNANSGYTTAIGATAYDITGSSTGNNKKYKWIGFRFTDNDITTTSNGTSYINIYSKLQNYFNSNTLIEISNGNTDTICLVKVGNRIGHLYKGFNPLSTWFTKTLTNKSLAQILDINDDYGSLFKVSNTDWGPVLNPDDTSIVNSSSDTSNDPSSGIFIIIGLNNSVNL